MPGPSCSRLAGRFCPAPLGADEDDRSGSVGSLDPERDDSFASVLSLIREFHDMEEPAGIAPNRCKTFLAPVYGLQSESSPALHLPTSPLLESLLEDVNSALAKFVEDQTVHGFFPIKSLRHRMYHRTSSSSFPGPYSVPPGLASITLKRVSDTKKRSVSFVPLPGFLFGNVALECLRGHVMSGLVAFDLWGFPRTSVGRSPCELRATDALWFEGS